MTIQPSSTNIPVYIIHYTPFLERLRSIEKIISTLGWSNVQIIKAFDAEYINPESYPSNLKLWNYRISDIRHVLVANFLSLQDQDLDYATHYNKANMTTDIYPWMQARLLKHGELSVLLKHFYAIWGHF